MRDSAGKSVVLVSTDLFAMSGRIHERVAKAFENHSADHKVVLTPDELLLAATHTHQSPGNYLGASLYNGFGSRVAGFSEKLENYLIKQIVRVIDDAVDDALAPSHRTFTLVHNRGTVPPTLFYNRSPVSFMHNPEASALMVEFYPPSISADECDRARTALEPADDWHIEGCPRLRATDPRISVLRLLRERSTRAVVIFTAVHPTVLPAETPFYSGDLFSVAATHIAADIQQEEHAMAPPIVTFFNGPEGDVLTRRTSRDLPNLHALSNALSSAVRSATNDSACVLGPTDRITTRLHRAESGESVPGEPDATLARHPLPGAAALGGGEGDRTSMYQLGWRPGVRKATPDAEQGVKQAALDPVDARLYLVSKFIGPDWSYPSALPFGLVRIGPLTLASSPFEVTTSVGAAARKGIQEALPGTREEIVGLADEYASYTVSDAEYDAQDYMGAFTLWGPRQARYLIERMKWLAKMPGNGITGTSPSFSPGLPTEFNFDYIGSGRTLPESDLGTVLSNKRSEMPPVPRITWTEVNAGPEKEFSKVGVRSVMIERLDGPKGTETENEHFILVLIQNAPSRKPVEWAALWGRPLVETVIGTYRFVVTTGDGQRITGAEFALK